MVIMRDVIQCTPWMPQSTGNEHYLITGCGKGIGLSCLRELIANNKSVKVLAITRTLTKELDAIIHDNKARIHLEVTDITNIKSVNKAITEYITANGMLHFAICNAGARSRISIESASVETYREVFEINTLAQINIVKTLLSLKKTEDHINVLMISSIVGQRGFKDLSTYGVSKAALEGFVKSAAIELASKNIQINSLNPGFIESSYANNFKAKMPELYQWTLEQTPMLRWGHCEEIAKLALFLVSPANSYMTGSIIYSDGGWTSK